MSDLNLELHTGPPKHAWMVKNCIDYHFQRASHSPAAATSEAAVAFGAAVACGAAVAFGAAAAVAFEAAEDDKAVVAVVAVEDAGDGVAGAVASAVEAGVLAGRRSTALALALAHQEVHSLAAPAECPAGCPVGWRGECFAEPVSDNMHYIIFRSLKSLKQQSICCYGYAELATDKTGTGS